MTQPSHIKTVTLENVRGYDCTLSFTQVNLAHGANETGKTGLLNAISAGLWGMIRTEFGGWVKDKGTLIDSLVTNLSKKASVRLLHQDGTCSTWSYDPKSGSVKHNPSGCVEPRGKEDLVRKILGATSPSARAGARKRFVEVFDSGIEPSELVKLMSADLQPLVAETVSNLGLGASEVIEALISDFKSRAKDTEEQAAAVPDDATPEVLAEAEAQLEADKAVRLHLREELGLARRFEEGQKLGDLKKTQQAHKEAAEQLRIHQDDLASMKAQRDAEMAALGYSSFDADCRTTAMAHLGHLDGTCRVCGAEASAADFQAAVAEVNDKEAKVKGVKAKYSDEIISIAEGVELWNAEVNKLAGQIEVLKRLGELKPATDTAENIQARLDVLDSNIASGGVRIKALRDGIQARENIANTIAMAGRLRRAVAELVKIRDDRFISIVDEFCDKITAGLPKGWAFNIDTTDDEFKPYMVVNGRTVVDPSGAQADILVAAAKAAAPGTPIDIAGERDYDVQHLGWNIQGMLTAPDTQFFLQSTRVPVGVDSPAGRVTFINVEQVRRGE